MKPYFAAPPDSPNRSSLGGCDDEEVQRRLDLCISLIRLVGSLEQLIRCYNGEITGEPPQLRLAAHYVLEFEERAGKEPDDEMQLIIRRIHGVA